MLDWLYSVQNDSSWFFNVQNELMNEFDWLLVVYRISLT